MVSPSAAAYMIAFWAPGKRYAGMTGKPRSAEEAADIVRCFAEDHADLDWLALVKLAPSSFTLSDGYRVTIDPIGDTE